MKSIIHKSLLFATIILITATGTFAQRIIKGTVYREGKPAAGINVEAHKGSSMLTSFDGLYQVEATAKSKWIKFTFIDDSKKLDIAENPSNEFDFYFDDIKPAGSGMSDSEVNNKSFEELRKDQDMVFMNEYSLYFEFNAQKDYESAYPHWEVIYNKYPKSTKNIYIHGIDMEESFLEKAASWDEKEKHIQKIMNIFDKRIKHFGQKGYVLGRKGTAWLKYHTGNDNMSPEHRKEVMKKGYEWLKESTDDQGIETETPVLILLLQTSSALFKMDELAKETVVQNYDLCNNLLNQMIAGEDKNQSEKAIEALPYLEQIFEDSGAADCEALLTIYTPQYEEKSEDIDFVKSILRKLRIANCEESELVNIATEKLYELDPSAEAAFNMARRFLKRDEIEKAKAYYKQAMDQETDEELLASYYYEYGLFIFAKENALNEAREYARKALALNPDYCEAIMLIGHIYVAASKSFSEDAFEKSTVFWLAVDYFNRAARAGETCAEDAANDITTYKAYFPNKEEGFFIGLTEGESYKIGGWINETTKVRY